MSEKELVDYILSFLQTRNGGELQEVFDNMKRRDYALLTEELELILEHRGKPPNWIN